MTLKLAISPPIIKESYAIYGSKSTQYMGLLFYDMCRFAVLFAYDSRSLVHDMANCNSLEAIKSFDISTGNHGADINNPPTCRHNMKTSSLLRKIMELAKTQRIVVIDLLSTGKH